MNTLIILIALCTLAIFVFLGGKKEKHSSNSNKHIKSGYGIKMSKEDTELEKQDKEEIISLLEKSR